MQRHELSSGDRLFRAKFEACRFARENFTHRAHVRLAYVYLAEHRTDAAAALMQKAKHHETLTRAWILAVRHFMESSPSSPSGDAFITHNPALLDSRIMLTHYSADVLFSDEARAQFVEPNLDKIPRHEGH